MHSLYLIELTDVDEGTGDNSSFGDHTLINVIVQR